VDLIVLSHHGSRTSITPALLGVLDCDRFIVATNGALFGHPDAEAIGLLGRDRARPATVYFNYWSATTAPYADEELQRRLNILAVYPEDGRPSTIAVSPSDGSGQAG
jgi:hypothetical protein